MASPSRSIDLRQASWRSNAAQGGGGLRRRRPRIALAVVVVAALAAMYAALLFRPLWRPRAHLELLAASDYAPLQAPPAEHVAHDLAAFVDLAAAFPEGDAWDGRPPVRRLTSRAEAPRLGERLRQASQGGADVLLVYLSAHGVSDRGEPYLLCEDLGRSSVAGGRVHLSEPLRALSQTPAKVKLLLLDAGRVAHEPRLGAPINEFPRLVERQVKALRDPSLWVFVSHGESQTSHVSPALGRSAFGYFVVRGLQGAADANGDQAVDLGELHRFVAANVRDFVSQTTGGAVSQTPLLFWGGAGETPSAAPWLLSVSRLDRAAAFAEASEAVAKAQAESQGTSADFSAQSLARTAARAATRPVPTRPTASSLVARGRMEARQEAYGALRQAAAEPPQQTSPAPTSPTPTPPSTAEAPPAAAAPADDTAPKKEAISPAAQKLAEAWVLRDNAAAADPGASARSVAPHWWRLAQERLVALEARLRTTPTSEAESLADIDHALALLASFEPRPPESAAGRAALGDARIAALVDAAAPWAVPAQTLAAARQLATPQEPLPAPLEEADQTLERLARDGTREDLAAWAAGVPAEALRFEEVWLAHRLASVDYVEGRPLRLALQAVRASAAAAECEQWLWPWIAEPLLAADRLRWSGQRALVDGIGSRFDRDAERRLSEAVAAYQQIVVDAAAVREAARLEQESLGAAPHYVRWLMAASESAPAAQGPALGDVRELLTVLHELAAALDHPGESRLGEVRNLTSRLARVRERIDEGFQSRAIADLVDPQASPGASAAIRQLLQTPLPGAADRLLLLAALPRSDSAAIARFGTIYQPAAPPSPTGLSRSDWRRREERMEIEWLLARLASPGGAESPLPALEAVEQSFQGFSAALRQWEAAANGDGTLIESLQDAQASFSAALLSFYRRLPDAIEAAAANPALDRTSLLPARRALALVDPRDAHLVDAAPLLRAIARRQWRDCLTLRYARARAALEDASPAALAYHANAAQEIAALLDSAASGRTAEIDSLAAVEIAAPSSLSLIQASSVEFPVTLQLRGVAPERSVWLAIKSDPELLDVRILPEGAAYREQDHPPGAFDAPYRPDLLGLPASFALRAGAAKTVRLRVTRVQPFGRPTRLVLKAIVPDAATSLACVRKEMAVALPAPQAMDLAVQGPPGASARLPDGVELRPFPNRKTKYQLRLTSAASAPRSVNVAMLIPQRRSDSPLPSFELPPGEVEAALAPFDPSPPIVTLSGLALAAGESIALPFPADAVKSEPSPPQPPSSANGAAALAAEAKVVVSDEPLAIPREMLVVMTDANTGWGTVRRLVVAPQRPRRYVRPQVRYNAEREELEIRVAADDPLLAPAGGVHIACEYHPPLPPAALARRQASLAAPDYAGLLYAELPKTAPETTVYLHVDNFPRAFIYRVRPADGTRAIPEDAGALAARITALPLGTIYQAPADRVPVEVAIDAPSGAFASPDDMVRVGIDKNRDRDLRDDDPLTIRSDRQVTVTLDQLAPQGEMWLDVQVTDLRLDLPGPGLFNARANVLAQVVVGGASAWSEPVEVVFDAAAPEPLKVELSPGRQVTLGEPLALRLTAADRQLSGVAKMEAALAPPDVDEMPAEPPPVVGLPGESGVWSAVVPADKPGVYQLLVRITDRAGNAATTSQGKVRIVTPEELAAEQAARTNRVAGTVVYGEQPQANIEVQLESAAGQVIGPIRTNDRGEFEFPRVPVGEWKISASGLVRGAQRVYPFDGQEKVVQVEPPPKAVPSQQLPLKTRRESKSP